MPAKTSPVARDVAMPCGRRYHVIACDRTPVANNAFLKGAIEKELFERIKVNDRGSGLPETCFPAGGMPPLLTEVLRSSRKSRMTSEPGPNTRHVTDVTAPQNTAYGKWYNHPSTEETFSRQTRRLQNVVSTCDPVRTTYSPARPKHRNSLLGGGKSAYSSWTTTYRDEQMSHAFTKI
eukprot:TRINITY_DN36024_c0_g1_i1.p1 TRINITY_DN36024_c0_g1~~TRINITY_DN36024_c0_g1_i1.p1  ORF type:complete len:178 (-),score=31.51 TRINITY_DN36024_c0_g1_i1:37-570(-)